MSDGCTVDTHAKHETEKGDLAERQSLALRSERNWAAAGTRLIIEAHRSASSFGRAREVCDETVQIFGRKRANAKLRESSVTKTHMIRHWQGGTL